MGEKENRSGISWRHLCTWAQFRNECYSYGRLLVYSTIRIGPPAAHSPSFWLSSLAVTSCCRFLCSRHMEWSSSSSGTAASPATSRDSESCLGFDGTCGGQAQSFTVHSSTNVRSVLFRHFSLKSRYPGTQRGSCRHPIRCPRGWRRGSGPGCSG